MRPSLLLLLFLVSICSAFTSANEIVAFVRVCQNASHLACWFFKEGNTVELELGKYQVYRRKVDAGKHVFRICTPKTKKNGKCGFWMNNKTKKRVKNAPKTKRQNAKFLVLDRVTQKDSGTYASDGFNITLNVIKKTLKG
ncbi:unnamed protein product [Caenorhabditis bovis]|uniref:Uncharacterized protein n=1 Tax=Caenorhabditis bovis TaxID=2654633 RepID=A0A8S1ECX9_9PELO|nr:unnamed protein product [Caenorhabditis bovis]